MAKHITVNAIVTVKSSRLEFLKNIGRDEIIDGISDIFVDPLQLELVSSEGNWNWSTMMYRAMSNDENASLFSLIDTEYETKYVVKLQVNEEFGKVGAITAINRHRLEMYVEDIVLEGLPQGVVKVICKSWVHSTVDNPEKRIFFIDKAYLPSRTPSGLRSSREKELENLRGNGGERHAYDRIYDYDTYNDLGDPDKNKAELLRPVLGSKEHPYPRRCRTGRPPTNADPSSEKRVDPFYVPRDEEFSAKKITTFTLDAVINAIHASGGLISLLEMLIENFFPHHHDDNLSFKSFKEILQLFEEGFDVSNVDHEKKDEITKILKFLFQSTNIFRFPPPDLMDRDEFAWFRDEEFARETLAGLNPYAIKLVTEWPLKSKLDPEVYGSPESAITSDIIEQQIKGIMSFNEALEQKKLFMLDYHDVLLPYVNKVRQIKGSTLYGSRTLFFLGPQGTLRPVAIELTRPPTDAGKPQWKQVFTPSSSDNATEAWLWKLAKAHVLAHDSGYHQLISHWLRTHCCVEPYIIATNRQLSAMHPIYKLLKPHFRFTMKINALARQSLINAGGTIESSFCMGRYSMVLSSDVYDQEWRFDQEGLPADLIRRGMAVEDPTSAHGLKLTIEDYPFANDGLLLWDAIKQWVSEYVTHYYGTDETHIKTDFELQGWWKEIRTKGHPDKKDEPWWPLLETRTDLINILSTMIWVASGHHAAVNFGQYAYAGYVPNRPTIARIKMPSEDPTEEAWNKFVQKPVDYLLQTFPSKKQAIKVMAVLNVLSDHSPDEEYIGGEQIEPWLEIKDPSIDLALTRFKASLKIMEKEIDKRNADVKLKNRNGVGTLPYTLLKPFSTSGVTGMGVPNSISI